MRNSLFALLALAEWLCRADLSVAAPPDWVADQYRKYIVQSEDNRSLLERVLDDLGLRFDDTPQSFALVAGIDRYPRIAGSPGRLTAAGEDVAKFVSYLRDYEYFDEIVVLQNEAVTPEILRYFLVNYFPRRLADAHNPRFLFAYSGHGMNVGAAGYLLTSQAVSLDDRFGLGASIPMDELRAWIQGIVEEGYQSLILINACYGASFHRLSFGQRAPVPIREGAHAITAGSGGELTYADTNFGSGSIFFEAVLAGLDGRADGSPKDGVVTVRELDAYLNQVVSQFTGGTQNPVASDLIPTQSPGGFFFLDRRRRIDAGEVREFDPSVAAANGRQLIAGTRPAAEEPAPASPERKATCIVDDFLAAGECT